MANPEISKLKLNNILYDIKDAYARELIAGGLTFAGVTTTSLTDGSTATSVSIGGDTVTATNGMLVVNGNKEFVFSTSDNTWHELGDNTAFKALAYKDSASGSKSYTPAGTVTSTFTGATTTSTGKFTPNGSVTTTFTGGTTTSTGKFTPSGSVTVSTSGTTNKTATVSTATGAATYTPGGTVSSTFTGTQGAVNVSSSAKFMTGASAAIAKDATNGVQISGTVGAPTISVTTAGSTTSIKVISGVGSLPTWTPTYTTATETMEFTFTQGSLPTSANVTVKNGDAAYSASAPAFTGDKFAVTVTPTSATVSSSGNFTPAGTVGSEFSGTGVRLVTGNIAVPNTFTATFTGSEGTVTVTGTAAGSATSTFSGTEGTVTVTGTSAGSVTSTFGGTAATISITVS